MLFTRMDLLNSQFLDKMNNNIGRLHYDGLFVYVYVIFCVWETRIWRILWNLCVAVSNTWVSLTRWS